MLTGRVLLADGGFGSLVIAYALRVASLPFAVVGDWLALPILRLIDRGDRPWWVVEVRFHGWDAEFVRIAEAATRQEASARRDEINSVRSSRPRSGFGTEWWD
ncbi:MAG: hypothetical protein Q8M22_03185 [Actinomycetota bacterium]|nr:hypothetical protein [Actinomycetota bacterium]